jgi:CheY-like chemotaxis protein
MNPAKILLVEDDMFLRDIYSETLVSEGFAVSTAVDGVDALEKLKLGGWDLVLLDVVMPKMNGIEVMKQVMLFPQAPAKNILFLTNSDETKELEQVIEATSGYLMKSNFTPAQLVQKVRSYVS